MAAKGTERAPRAPLTQRTINNMLIARQDARARRERVYAERHARGRDRHVYGTEVRRDIPAERRLKNVRHKLAVKAKAGHQARVIKAHRAWDKRDRGVDPAMR